MSAEQPKRPQGPVWRVNPFLAVLLLLIGIVLLLGGLGSIYGIAVAVSLIPSGESSAVGVIAAILPLVLLGLVAAAAGIGLIVLVFRR